MTWRDAVTARRRQVTRSRGRPRSYCFLVQTREGTIVRAHTRPEDLELHGQGEAAGHNIDSLPCAKERRRIGRQHATPWEQMFFRC